MLAAGTSRRSKRNLGARRKRIDANKKSVQIKMEAARKKMAKMVYLLYLDYLILEALFPKSYCIRVVLNTQDRKLDERESIFNILRGRMLNYCSVLGGGCFTNYFDDDAIFTVASLGSKASFIIGHFWVGKREKLLIMTNYTDCFRDFFFCRIWVPKMMT